MYSFLYEDSDKDGAEWKKKAKAIAKAATEHNLRFEMYNATLFNTTELMPSMDLFNKTFCGFSMGRNQNWAGRVYDLCVYYMTGTPEGSTESDFKEKPGIEPATPGLQGIELNHYTTGASLMDVFNMKSYTQYLLWDSKKEI